MFTRVLLPTDFSPSAEVALKTVRQHFPEAAVRLLHVISPQQVAAFYTDTFTSPVDAAAARQRLVDEALSRLGTVAQAQEEKVAVVGQAADTILEHAAHWQPDLIVMGTHGRTGLTHFLNGSVAETVVRHARLPVLIVHEVQQAQAAP
jgi:nucleotide-binding universal stress UspA family protein